MKILEVNHSLSSGGGERFVVDLCNRFACNKEDDIFFLMTDDSRIQKNVFYQKTLDKAVNFFSLNSPSGYSLKSIIGVLWYIVKVKPDIVHFHCGFLVTLLPAILYRRPQYIHTLHSLPQRCVKNKYEKKIAFFLYKRGFVHPVTISDECHTAFVDFYGIKNIDTCIINGREPLLTTSERDRTKNELLKLGVVFSQDIPTFITVARNHPVKNHKRLYNTFVRLHKEGTKFNLLIIGTGYEKYIAEESNLPGLFFLGQKDNIGDYMSFANYFVLTSDMEGLPLALLEAMSMGVIPVCTPAGGVKDVIKNGINGFIAEEISDTAFYNSVKQALDTTNRISKDSIVNDYQNHYSMKVCSEKYYQLYMKINSDITIKQ